MISSCYAANPAKLDTEVGQWWTDFIEGDAAAREALLTQGGTKEKSPRKRRRRGGVRNRKPGEGAAEQAPDARAVPTTDALAGERRRK